MERKETMLKTGCVKILWAVMVIVLCAAPTLRADVTVPAGETWDIPSTEHPGPIIGSLWVNGTVNLLPGASVEWFVYATETSIVNIKGGTVGYWIDVAVGASVTVYGTDFNLGEGEHFIDFGTVTGFYENGDPINLTFDCQPGATVTLAAPGSEPPENTPPVADAGPDITVSTLDVASTIIQGTATDEDVLDPLQYRWLEGTVEFTLWASVGVNGEAYLDLGTILPQYLSVGTHILTLEVKDFEETVSDEMVLEILPTHIDIDIKPGSYPNAINLGSQGVIPVAILSTADFDATTINPDTVFLAGSSVAVRGKGNKSLASVEDVNGDSLLDLVVKVETENLDPGQFQNGTAILQVIVNGIVIYEGSDEITIVPPE